MPEYGFGRCDGHHEMVDLQKKRCSGTQLSAVVFARASREEGVLLVLADLRTWLQANGSDPKHRDRASVGSGSGKGVSALTPSPPAAGRSRPGFRPLQSAT